MDATMGNKPDDNALGKFLRDRRSRLDPAGLGFPVTRRRTPGLRREEVALLANVSPAWYMWLEQGRGGTPSADVLDRLARGCSTSSIRLSSVRQSSAPRRGTYWPPTSPLGSYGTQGSLCPVASTSWSISSPRLLDGAGTRMRHGPPWPASGCPVVRISFLLGRRAAGTETGGLYPGKRRGQTQGKTAVGRFKGGRPIASTHTTYWALTRNGADSGKYGRIAMSGWSAARLEVARTVGGPIEEDEPPVRTGPVDDGERR